MGRVIYALNVSLDGFVETPEHSLDWTAVDEELHTWFNDRARELDAALYGRRLYELMADAWPQVAADASAPPHMQEFGRIWLDTPRYVFSSTLERAEHGTVVRGGVREELARIRKRHSGDMEVAGATLAASFIREGLVDEFQLVIHPVAIGGGTPYWPPLERALSLRLVDSHAFTSGVQMLAYRPA
ncbi:MAG TPA: dihydrofolate reductase family protein [Candidatus Limnocylindria bacterium]|jgi:dihydrofolate reductase|nr:dihydrofolate reductase family protein [Candidatus Limnocylindria bacterium]